MVRKVLLTALSLVAVGLWVWLWFLEPTPTIRSVFSVLGFLLFVVGGIFLTFWPPKIQEHTLGYRIMGIVMLSLTAAVGLLALLDAALD